MSRVQQYQASFTIGELDPLLRGRIDLQQYYTSVASAKNVIFEPQGGFSRRPGLKFLQNITADNAEDGVMLVPFEFSSEESFMFVMVAQKTNAPNPRIRMYIYKDKQLLTNLNGSGNDYIDRITGSLYSVTDFDLKRLYFTQSADTLICVHPNFEPFKVVRGATDTDWTVSAISNLVIPMHQFNASNSTPSATLTPDKVDGTVTLTASSSVFTSADVDQYVEAANGFGRARIVNYVSGTEVEAFVEVPFFNTDAIASGDWELQAGYEEAWSNTQGWPISCTFHEGRLYFGGSASLPSTLFGSKVGQFFNFKAAEGLDDDAIKITLATDQVNTITGLRSGRDLQVFTTGAEFFIPQGDLDPITPSNVVAKSSTRRGAKPFIRPQAAEGGTLFIQRSGKAIRELLFSDVELSYVANNISLLASHLIVDPVKLALRAATDTTEGDLLLVLNGTDTTGYRAASLPYKGQIAAFMLNKGQNIVAPSHLVTDGDFIDVAVDQDAIYVVTKRNLATQAYATATITVTDYLNLAVGSTITLHQEDGTAVVFTSETLDITPPANPEGFRPYADNDTTATNLAAAINAHSGFSATATANVVTVTRADAGDQNLTNATSDSTRLTTTDFTQNVGDQYLVEVFDDDFTTDCAVQQLSGFSTATLSGLSHIESETVDIVRDDIVETRDKVTAGTVALSGVPTTYVEAGLAYDVEVVTNPVETRLSSGAIQGQRKRILEVTPLMYLTQNLVVNGRSLPLQSTPIGGGGGVYSYTGRKKTQGFLGYSRDAQITISQNEPLFMTVLALDYKVSVGQ